MLRKFRAAEKVDRESRHYFLENDKKKHYGYFHGKNGKKQKIAENDVGTSALWMPGT